jgi:MarR family transcriptional regulator for hemolysin
MSSASLNASDLGSGLIAAARRWQRMSQVALALDESGVSDACATPLLALLRLGNNVHQIDLARASGIGGSSLVRLLDQMCHTHLVERVDDPADRRANIVSLTTAGVALAQTLERRLEQLHSELLEGFSADELQTAFRVIEVLQRRNIRMRSAALNGLPDRER